MVRATSAKGPGMVANWLRNLGIGIVLGFLPLSSPLPAAPSQKVAPVAELVKTVDIPYQQFTLDNGLRVIVSTDRKAPVRSEEHTSELQSLMRISYAVFCLKKQLI